MNNWLPWIIGFLVILIASGPILMIRPSAKQKKQIALRNRAREKGFLVHIEQQEQGQFLIQYTLPWDKLGISAKTIRPWKLQRLAMSHEIHFSGRWNFQGEKPNFDMQRYSALSQSLEKLADDVERVEASKLGLGLVWREKCSIEEIDSVLARLQEWLALLSHELYLK